MTVLVVDEATGSTDRVQSVKSVKRTSQMTLRGTRPGGGGVLENSEEKTPLNAMLGPNADVRLFCAETNVNVIWGNISVG